MKNYFINYDDETFNCLINEKLSPKKTEYINRNKFIYLDDDEKEIYSLISFGIFGYYKDFADINIFYFLNIEIAKKILNRLILYLKNIEVKNLNISVDFENEKLIEMLIQKGFKLAGSYENNNVELLKLTYSLI